MVWTTNIVSYRTIGALVTPTPFNDSIYLWPIIWNSPVNESPYYLPIQKYSSGTGTPQTVNNQLLVNYANAEFYGISSRVVSMSVRINNNYLSQTGNTKYIFSGFMIPLSTEHIPYGYQSGSTIKRYILDDNQDSGGLPTDPYFFLMPYSSRNIFRNARESDYIDTPELVEHPWQLPDPHSIESEQYIPFSFGHYNTFNQSVTDPEHKPITYDITMVVEYFSEKPLSASVAPSVFKLGLTDYRYLEICAIACDVLNTFRPSAAKYYSEYLDELQGLIERLNWLKPKLRSRLNCTGSAAPFGVPHVYLRDIEENNLYY